MEPYPNPAGDPALDDYYKTADFYWRVRNTRPIATWVLVGINLLIGLPLVAAQMLGLGRLVDLILGLGSLTPPAIWAGETWRLLTSLFLHANLVHLGFNTYAIWVLGRFVEVLYGTRRYFFVYFGTGLFSCLASMAFLPITDSVGASGAIFGLLGLLAGSAVFQRGSLPSMLQSRLAWNLVFIIVLNFAIGLAVPMINNYAHLGGLVGGVLLSALIVPPLGRRPTLTAPRLAVTLLGLALAAGLAVTAAKRDRATLAYVLASFREVRGQAQKLRYTQALESALAATGHEENPALRALALNNLAYTYLELDESLERAHDLAKQAVALIPDEPSFLDTLAYFAAAAGDCEQAEALMARALAADARYERRQREVKEACRAGRKPRLDVPVADDTPVPGIRI